MVHNHSEEQVAENQSCKEVTFVRRAGTFFAASVLAVLAVAAVGVYALVGGNSIPTDDEKPSVTTTSDTSSADDLSDDEESEETTQAAVTWKKAGIDEYDLVIETVKATETTKTTTKKTETSKTSAKTTTQTTVADSAEPTTQQEASGAVTQSEERKSSPNTVTESDTEEDAEEVRSCSEGTYVAVEKTNMRNGPSLDNDVITVISEGAEVTVTGYTDNWYRIRYNDSTGYCMKRYFEEASDESSSEESTESSGDVISYTDEEFTMLCYVIQGEVGNCSDESKIAVSNVVINRVKSSAFPDSISEVLTQANQFTAVYNYYNGTNTPTDDTIECVKKALAGEDNSNGAIYYYAPKYCSSSTAAWFESLTFCLEIDGQRYFK